MGCLQTKAQYSRNFILDSKRRQKLYGLSIENIDNFWMSEDFKTFRNDFYRQNPTQTLELGKVGPVPNSYIDTWNIWKNKQESLKKVCNLPYPSELKNPYYLDIFSEILDIECIRSINLCQPRIPRKHLPVHFKTVKNYCLTQSISHYQQYSSIDDYVNRLLDENEYHELVKKFMDNNPNIIPNNNPKIIPNNITTKIII